MKNLILTAFLLISGVIYSCDGSTLSLVSGPTALGGGLYSVTMSLCTTQGAGCQNFETGAFSFGVNGATINKPASTASITSPHTSAVYSQDPTCTGCPTGYTDVMLYNNGVTWFATLFGKKCNTLCNNVTLVLNGFPTSITVRGLEGNNNPAAGCSGAALSLNFINPLPIDLISFNGDNIGNINHLQWVTASEKNNDYFIIENSTDGNSWNTVGMVNGAGNSTIKNTYDLDHRNTKAVINYYRLTQVDFDGNREVFYTIAIDNSKEKKTLVKTVNLMGQEVDENYHGLILKLYSDGTCIKEFK